MRIGIDARMYRLSGVGTYLENLLNGLAELDGETEYLCFLREEDIGGFSPPGSNFRAIPCLPPIYSLREQWALPLLARRQGLNLIHYPHYASPLFNPCPAVITVHDLIHILFPKYLPGLHAYAYARAMFFGASRRARLIIAVSENTRQDLMVRLGVRSEKMRVVHNGLGPEFKPPPSEQEDSPWRERHGAGRPYFLYVGNHKAHKNIPRLLEAFSLVRKEAQVRLLLTGRGEALESLVRKLEIEEDVVFTGWVEREEMPRLYHGALALVFPSEYEGFGFPPLEAMACGTPVITSDCSSLPEVVGDAAIKVSPRRVDHLAEGMYNLLIKADLRTKLRERGLERASRFSREQMARGTLAVYREALGMPPDGLT